MICIYIDMNPFTHKKYGENYYELKKILSKLPANGKLEKKKIEKTIKENYISILEMSTGAGKSATVPITIAKMYKFKKKIVMSQPRVLTTITLSKFLSAQLDVELGTYVGYKHGKGSNLNVKKSKITLVTDAILVLQLIENIEKYDIVIIDEVHERNINMDILLMLIKKYFEYYKKINQQPKVKFILLSATIDSEKFIKYFENITDIGHLFIEGRSKPIEHIFIDEKPDIEKIIDKIITESTDGDILVFVPTISKLMMNIDHFSTKYPNIIIGGLYRGVNEKDETLLVNPNKQRKLIFATTVAETGITIPGIVYVIESGKSNIVTLNQFTGEIVVKTGYIYKSNSIQRCGRSGRVRSGVCYHLYSKDLYNKMRDYESPEIYRSDLRSMFLKLVFYTESVKLSRIFIKSMIDRIPTKISAGYWKNLYDHGLISGDNITILGKYVAQLGIEIDFAILIIYGFLYNVQRYIIPIVVLMTYNRSPQKLFTINTSYKKYINIWGDPVAFYMIYLYFLTNFQQKQKNIKKKLYNKRLKQWCDKNDFIYPIFKNLKRDIDKLIININSIQQEKDEVIKMYAIENIKDTIPERIIKCFIKTFTGERAIYQPINDTYYTQYGGDEIAKDNISPLLNFKVDHKLIGYTRKIILKGKNTIVILACVFSIITF